MVREGDDGREDREGRHALREDRGFSLKLLGQNDHWGPHPCKLPPFGFRTGQATCPGRVGGGRSRVVDMVLGAGLRKSLELLVFDEARESLTKERIGIFRLVLGMAQTG